MNKETGKRPHKGGKRMFAQVQTSVEIISPVPENGKCGEKEYERIFICYFCIADDAVVML